MTTKNYVGSMVHMTFSDLLDRKLDPKPISEFSNSYLEKHAQVDHEIPQLTGEPTVLDVISFVFDNNPDIVADFLQALLLEEKDAIELLELMIETVEEGDSCLICLKVGINDYFHPV